MMKLFEWLFGAKRPAPQAGKHSDAQEAFDSVEVASRDRLAMGGGPALEVSDRGADMLHVPSLDFFGTYKKSPSGRFRVAWRDGNGSRNGARGAGEGHYLVLDGDRLSARGRMQRPNDGKIADNGTFILNDWRFTAELSGTFNAFKVDGSPIMARSFAANLMNNGLSADGQFAACHTAGSDSDSDSAILVIFDLVRGVELARFRPESGWPNSYEFLPDKRTIRLRYPNGEGNFGYTFDGDFLDRDAWTKLRLERGDLRLVRGLLDKAAGKPDGDLAKRLMAAIEIGMSLAAWRDDRWQAFGWRLQGEVFEARGEPTNALAAYEKALNLDSRIGLKRRVGQLKQALSAK